MQKNTYVFAVEKLSMCVSGISIPSQRSAGIICNCIFIPYIYSAIRYFTTTSIRPHPRVPSTRNISPFGRVYGRSRAAVISSIKLPDGRRYKRSTICLFHSLVIRYLPDCARTCNPLHTFAKLPTCLPSSSACLSAYLLVFLPVYLRVQSVY